MFPLILSAETPAVATRLMARYREAMSDPDLRSKVVGPAASQGTDHDGLLDMLLVDDLAGVLGANIRIETRPGVHAKPDCDSVTVWSTGAGELVYWDWNKTDHASRSRVATAVLAAMGEDRTVDAIGDEMLVRDMLDAVCTDLDGTPIFLLRDVNERLAQAAGAATQPQVLEAAQGVRLALVRLVVLSALHMDLLATARQDHSQDPELRTHRNRVGALDVDPLVQPHLSRAEDRELDSQLCEAMQRQCAQIVGGLEVLEAKGVITARGSGQAWSGIPDRDNASLPITRTLWFAKKIDARLQAMRMRFSGFDATGAHAAYANAFRSLPVGPVNEGILTAYERQCAEQVYVQEYINPPGGAAQDPNEAREAVQAAYEAMRDMSDAKLIAEARKTLGDEKFDTAVAQRMLGDQRIPEGLRREASVQAALVAPVMERLAKGELRQVSDAAAVPISVHLSQETPQVLFATLSDMSRRDVMLRIATPEGAQIARGVLIAQAAVLDRDARGMANGPSRTDDFGGDLALGA